jgi:hypothetical protein|tara:strand:- start:287 stop:541 length:255 start_codon:yes stop_codon:yes gene_type:complete
MMPDHLHVGQWKAGQMPTIDSCLVVVTYDQTSRAYVIDKDDYFSFCEWICGELIDEYDVETDHPDDFMHAQGITIKRTNLEDVR